MQQIIDETGLVGLGRLRRLFGGTPSGPCRTSVSLVGALVQVVMWVRVLFILKVVTLILFSLLIRIVPPFVLLVLTLIIFILFIGDVPPVVLLAVTLILPAEVQGGHNFAGRPCGRL